MTNFIGKSTAIKIPTEFNGTESANDDPFCWRSNIIDIHRIFRHRGRRSNKHTKPRIVQIK
jgi:hypothetical protein